MSTEGVGATIVDWTPIDVFLESGGVNRLIAAIKNYREQTGAGLRESKEAVQSRAVKFTPFSVRTSVPFTPGLAPKLMLSVTTRQRPEGIEVVIDEELNVTVLK